MKPALRRLRTAFRPGVKILEAPPGIEVDWDVPVKVRDGMVLRVDVFRPKDGAPVPVIMSAHPYGKDEIPARTRSGRGVDLQYRLFPQPHPIEFSEWTSWEPPDPAFWVPRAYAVVDVDLRGGGTSEGVGELVSYQEAMDLILTALIVAISVQSELRSASERTTFYQRSPTAVVFCIGRKFASRLLFGTRPTSVTAASDASGQIFLTALSR